MLNAPLPRWAYVVIALVVALVLDLSLPASQTLRNATQEEAATDTSQNYRSAFLSSISYRTFVFVTEKIGEISEKYHDGITAFSTFIIACFTVTLWWATRGQLNQLRESIDLTRNEFIASHHHKIRVKHVWLKSEIWKGEKIVVELVIVNIGGTTANIFGGNFATLVIPADTDLPAKPPLPDEKRFSISEPLLRIGITFDLPEISDGRILTDEENAGIRQGAMRLYCFGCVDYTDISESARVKKTAFCRVLEVPKTPRSYQDVGRLVVHHDADYEYQD